MLIFIMFWCIPSSIVSLNRFFNLEMKKNAKKEICFFFGPYSPLILYLCQKSSMDSEKIILGIDPGTMVMGYGVIREQGKQMELLTMGVINLKKLENQALKLKKIFERVLEIIDEYHPDELAIEAPFFGKNVQSMLKLGRAQGVAMAAALYRDIPIFEYSPKTIKQNITGNGNASKEQVAKMVHFILKTEEDPQFFDATDAVAAAVCHSISKGKDVNYTKHTTEKAKAHRRPDWSQFIAENPDRVKKS